MLLENLLNFIPNAPTLDYPIFETWLAKLETLFLLNPGCLQFFSLSGKNLYYNLLPFINPKEKTISKFLNKIVFCTPTHEISAEANKLLVEYQLLALTRYVDKAQKPYYMKKQLSETEEDV